MRRKIVATIRDIRENWHNYRKEFTDNESAKPDDYLEAIEEYAEKLVNEKQ